MDDQQTIRQLAELFRIAPSALRYWDQEGLIRFERAENNYRMATWKTMMDICDVALHRKLSIPLKTIRQLPTMNEQQLNQMLDESEERLHRQIEEIKQTIELIHDKRTLLKEFNEMKYKVFQIVEVLLHMISSFTQERCDMEIFISDDTLSCCMLDEAGHCEHGLMADAPKERLLREADPIPQRYIKGILKIASDDAMIDNRSAFYEYANKIGVKGHELIGRFLLCACEEVRYDYYIGWLRISNDK